MSKKDELNKLKEYRSTLKDIEAMDKLLLSNNDLLEEPISEEYKDYLNRVRKHIRNSMPNNLTIYYLYSKIVNDLVLFIKNNTEEDDIIEKYTLLLKIIDTYYADKNNKDLFDYNDCSGLNAVFGNCCCRHFASLMYDVRKHFTDVKRICLGSSETDKANHCIIAVFDKQENKYLFLDSVKPLIYNYEGDYKLKTFNNKVSYIKANYSVTYYNDFDNIDIFIKFYKNLDNSKLSFGDYCYLSNRVYMSYYYLNEDRKSKYNLIRESIDLKKKQILTLIPKFDF